MFDDLRAAFRSLKSAPTFTAVALAVLALGIGAGTAIFSVVDAVVLRGLPFDEHDRLAVVLEHDTKRPDTFGGGTTTAQMFLDWRTLQQSFDGLAAIGGWSFRLRNDAGEPMDARGQKVSWEFFRVLRAAPTLGRAFGPEDEILGRHRVAILSHGFWQRRFGGDPSVVGRVVELSEESWEIVGVLPPWFAYPVDSDKPAEIFAPVAFTEQEKVRAESRNYNWTVIGRLKRDTSLSQAHEQMNGVAAALDAQYPTWSPGRRVRVIGLHEHIVGRVRGWMLMMLGAVALVLLIACANVANLLLARATVRGREIGIRAALGAGRWRLVRGLIVEGLLLSVCGAAFGVILAYGGVQVMNMWLPAGMPRVAGIGIDLRVLAAAVAAAIASGLFFGLAPALASSKPDLTSALKEAGRSASASLASQRLRNVLVVSEVALAVILLVGAGLFIGSFVKLMSVDTGLDYHNVLVLNVGGSSRPRTELTPAERTALARTTFDRFVAAMSQVPGAEMVSAVQGGLPLSGSWSRNRVTLPGGRKLEGDDSIDRRIVTPDYLQMLRIPLKSGRYLSRDDRDGAPLVVVINEAAARKYWPGQDPLGQRINIGDTKDDRTVVGVVGDIRHLGPEKPVRQECYVTVAQGSSIPGSFAIRTSGDPLAILPAVKAAIWSVNKDARIFDGALTLEAYMDRLIAQRRFNMALLSLFGVLGLVIAAVGIYGVMAYVVAQRTSEIGVRMALGATRGNVMAMVLGRAAILMAAGLAIGGAAAWYLSAGVRPFLFEVEPNDARIFAGAVITLAATGLAASALPARRAASVDPLVALRHQ
jgi:putative ABC transport system permease protein